MSLARENYLQLCKKVDERLQKSSRPPGSAQILVVSKGQPALSLKEMSGWGQRAFGENYLQEWRTKKSELQSILSEKAPREIQWHFIGRLQSNKLKYLAGEISLFHSLDRWEIALQMNEISKKRNEVSRVLIEVNLAYEKTKGGISGEELQALIQQMNSLEHLQLQGLMIFPPPCEDPEDSRPYFRQLREILLEINRKSVYKESLSELSMGMSNDYLVAIEEGATWLRIGRAIFKQD